VDSFDLIISLDTKDSFEVISFSFDILQEICDQDDDAMFYKEGDEKGYVEFKFIHVHHEIGGYKE
jgi:hypothetical protein